MSMLKATADGAFLFIALEDDATGFQLIFKIVRPTSSTPTTTLVYEPGGGSAGNITPTTDNDLVIFNGNFNTDVGVIRHAITAGTNTDITPATIGADVIQPAEVDPNFTGGILVWNDTDSDLLETEDAGVSWTTLRSDAGLIAASSLGGMDVLFKGNFQDHNIYVVGDGGSGVKVYESLDKGTTLTALENAALNTAADVVGIYVAGAT